MPVKKKKPKDFFLFAGVEVNRIITKVNGETVQWRVTNLNKL